MFKLPLVIVYGVIALNITLFTLLLQMDFLIFKALAAKIIAWIFTVAAWGLTYVNRKKVVKMF